MGSHSQGTLVRVVWLGTISEGYYVVSACQRFWLDFLARARYMRSYASSDYQYPGRLELCE